MDYKMSSSVATQIRVLINYSTGFVWNINISTCDIKVYDDIILKYHFLTLHYKMFRKYLLYKYQSIFTQRLHCLGPHYTTLRNKTLNRLQNKQPVTNQKLNCGPPYPTCVNLQGSQGHLRG